MIYDFFSSMFCGNFCRMKNVRTDLDSIRQTTQLTRRQNLCSDNHERCIQKKIMLQNAEETFLVFIRPRMLMLLSKNKNKNAWTKTEQFCQQSMIIFVTFSKKIARTYWLSCQIQITMKIQLTSGIFKRVVTASPVCCRLEYVLRSRNHSMLAY